MILQTLRTLLRAPDDAQVSAVQKVLDGLTRDPVRDRLTRLTRDVPPDLPRVRIFKL